MELVINFYGIVFHTVAAGVLFAIVNVNGLRDCFY